MQINFQNHNYVSSQHKECSRDKGRGSQLLTSMGFTSSWHITENMRERLTGVHTAGSQRQLTSGAAETKQLKDYHSKKVLVLT